LHHKAQRNSCLRIHNLVYQGGIGSCLPKHQVDKKLLLKLASSTSWKLAS